MGLVESFVAHRIRFLQLTKKGRAFVFGEAGSI
jgi:hypothetical protein